MRPIKTYSKGAPFYNASSSRNVAFGVLVWVREPAGVCHFRLDGINQLFSNLFLSHFVPLKLSKWRSGFRKSAFCNMRIPPESHIQRGPFLRGYPDQVNFQRSSRRKNLSPLSLS